MLGPFDLGILLVATGLIGICSLPWWSPRLWNLIHEAVFKLGDAGPCVSERELQLRKMGLHAVRVLKFVPPALLLLFFASFVFGLWCLYQWSQEPLFWGMTTFIP